MILKKKKQKKLVENSMKNIFIYIMEEIISNISDEYFRNLISINETSPELSILNSRYNIHHLVTKTLCFN